MKSLIKIVAGHVYVVEEILNKRNPTFLHETQEIAAAPDETFINPEI